MEDLSVWWPVLWTFFCVCIAILWVRIVGGPSLVFFEVVVLLSGLLCLSLVLTGWLVWALLTPPIIGG